MTQVLIQQICLNRKRTKLKGMDIFYNARELKGNILQKEDAKWNT